MSDKVLLVFQKNPVLGKVKTRLAATVGDQRALSIYRELLDYTFKQISFLSDLDIWIFFSDFMGEIPKSLSSQNPTLRMQTGEDLGERMKNAFEEVFKNGYAKAVIIGTDCPEITSTIVNEAYNSLDSNEVVIGPAFDGGYYLLGMRELAPEIFQNKPWSTDKVLSETIATLNNSKSSYQLLPVLNDIDVELDWLKHLKTVTEIQE